MYNYILNLFTSTDYKFRPQLTAPGTIGNDVFATNSYSIIMVPKSRLSHVYERHQKFLSDDIRESFFDHAKYPLIKEDDFDIHKLAELLSCAKIHFQKLNCEKCGGEGVVRCTHCGNDSDCEECDGTGKDKDCGFFIRESDMSHSAIQFMGVYYRPVEMEKVLISILALKPDKIQIRRNSDCTKTLFILDDVEIVTVHTVSEA